MNVRIGSLLDLKGHHVETTAPDTTVFAAVALMNAKRIGALVVVEAGRPIGIFTERDVLVRVVARERDPREITVGEVMTRDPVTIRSDATLGEAMVVVTTARCRHLPVVDGGSLRGLISIGDLTSWMVRDQQRTIDDLHDYIRAA
jgi:CBS domain-containing protein